MSLSFINLGLERGFVRTEDLKNIARKVSSGAKVAGVTPVTREYVNTFLQERYSASQLDKLAVCALHTGKTLQGWVKDAANGWRL